MFCGQVNSVVTILLIVTLPCVRGSGMFQWSFGNNVSPSYHPVMRNSRETLSVHRSGVHRVPVHADHCQAMDGWLRRSRSALLSPCLRGWRYSNDAHGRKQSCQIELDSGPQARYGCTSFCSGGIAHVDFSTGSQLMLTMVDSNGNTGVIPDNLYTMQGGQPARLCCSVSDGRS